jgi:DNA-binding CsgD family transcriptional regulator/tetratricopeptide (TPR) repeat protein
VYGCGWKSAVHEPIADGELLERGRELESIAAVLARASSGSGGVMLIRGPGGVGKTELLRATCRRATDAGVAAFSARGTELERDLPYGLVRQLADRVLAAEDAQGRAELLAGPSAGAIARVLDMAGSAAADDPGLLIPHGLFWFVANLASRGPLVLAVDDAQWCDPASGRFLTYLAPRLEGMPVLLSVAGRDDEPTLPALFGDSTARLLEPRDLSYEAMSQLVRSRLSPQVEAEFCRACHEVTAGNPFYVHQLIDELRAQRFSGVSGEASRVRELGPRTVSTAVYARLARLPAPALALARAIAVLGEQAEYRHVLALSELDQDQAVTAIESLTSAALVDDVRPLRFVHPIVRNAIYNNLAHSARALAHRRAAQLLIEEGATSELVAAQLLLSEPNADPIVVEVLLAAAADALARGSPDGAVACLARALAEPPTGASRGRVLLELGRAEALAYDPAALERLAAASVASDDPLVRAQASRLLARTLVLMARWPEALEVLEGAASTLGDSAVEREVALAVASDRAFVSRLTPAVHGERRRELERLRELLGDSIDGPSTPAERTAVTQIAVDETSLCEPADRVVVLARLALADGRLLAEETSDSPNYTVAASVLLYADRLDEATGLFGAAIEDARKRGSVAGFVQGCCFRAHAALRKGDIAGAEADARSSLETEDKPMPQLLPMQLAVLVDALVERRELDAADHELASRGLGGELSDDYHAAHMLDSRARLRLAQARPDDALRDALDSGRRQEAMQMPNPAIVPWRSTAALAAAATGDHASARELAEAELELARAFGAPRALGIALRARALMSDTRFPESLAQLQAAVEVLEDSPARLELARALIQLGIALRHGQQRADARVPLRRGLDLALALGAVGMATMASQELAATGAKPRRLRTTGVTALTPSESRIARMAADGLTNSQIAQALFLTPRTVEMHLTSTYRKLGIGSRTQLSDALSRAA